MPITPEMAQIAASGVQQGGNLLSEILFNKRRKKESELQYQRQIDLMNMQNQYNSPASQMARYKAAGLNPNLIYGQGTPGNTATSTPNYSPPQQIAPKMDGINILGILTAVADLNNKKVQNDYIQEQTRAVEQKRLNDGIMNSILGTRNLSDQMKYQFQGKAFDYNLEALKYKNLVSSQTLQNMAVMNRKLEQDILKSQQDVKYGQALTAYTWDKEKYAREGYNLRTPSQLEQMLNAFLTGLTDHGVPRTLEKTGQFTRKNMNYLKYASPMSYLLFNYLGNKK